MASCNSERQAFRTRCCLRCWWVPSRRPNAPWGAHAGLVDRSFGLTSLLRRRSRVGSRARRRTVPVMGSALLPELDPPVDRLQLELPAARADGALDAALGEAALDGEGEVGGDVAVDGLGAELGVEAGGEVDPDGAVDGLEGQLALPVGAALAGVDAAVHGLAAGHPCRLDADVAVHGVGL